MAHSVEAISLETILRILVGRRSGPDAFEGFKLLSSFSIQGAVKFMSGIAGTWSPSISGRLSSGSLVNCEVYWTFKASAFSVGSLMTTWSGFRAGILLSPDFLCLM